MNSTTEPDILGAAAYVVRHFKTPPEGQSTMELDYKAACKELFSFVQHLIQSKRELFAAQILWPKGIFTTEPQSVKMIWEEIPKTSELLIMGAGSMGKSYTLAAWLVLDWLADPEWTCVKVCSMTAGHAKKNVFAHMKNLVTSSRIPIPHTKEDMVTDSAIMVNYDDHQGIHLLAIPQGDKAKGRARGFHPVPRPEAHKRYGSHSRVRVVLDEAEEIGPSVWADIDNLLLSKEGIDQIKIIAATNPVNINSAFANKAEPDGGWDTLEMDTSFRWKAKSKWDVIRIDGAQSENVKEKRLVHNGLLTWDGYQRYLADGEANPDYFTMARGWYPKKGLHMNVIPMDFVTNNVGTLQFSGPTIYCAGVDLALQGGDRAIMTIGRFGRCHGWIDKNGMVHMFKQQKICIQVEAQFQLPKAESVQMTKQIIQSCKTVNVEPMWLAVDRTGNGAGTHDLLRSEFGAEVLGVDYGTASTETKMFAEDSQKCSELYSGVVTELFFGVRRYLEFDYLKFSPYINMERLRPQLTGRKFKNKGDLVRVQSKDDYKAEGHKSPDDADSLTILVHLVRMRADMMASMLAIQPEQRHTEADGSGVVDKLAFIDFHSDT